MGHPAAAAVVKHVANYTKHEIVQKAVDWNAVVEEFEGFPQLENYVEASRMTRQEIFADLKLDFAQIRIYHQGLQDC
jgi:hypothetical protein